MKETNFSFESTGNNLSNSGFKSNYVTVNKTKLNNTYIVIGLSFFVIGLITYHLLKENKPDQLIGDFQFKDIPEIDKI